VWRSAMSAECLEGYSQLARNLRSINSDLLVASRHRARAVGVLRGLRGALPVEPRNPRTAIPCAVVILWGSGDVPPEDRHYDSPCAAGP
jgi:hypothetical protein